MEQEEFKDGLKKYYNHLLYRLDKGASYIEKNENNKKAQKLYQHIVLELSAIEDLMNFYGMEKTE